MPDQIDLRLATILNSPEDVVDWPIDCDFTRVQLVDRNTIIEFNAMNRWPSFQPSWSAPGDLMQYTLWGFEFINNRWYGSGVIQRWVGEYTSGDNIRTYQQDWFYDPGRWSPMTSKQLNPGDKFGYMVTNSDARNNGNTGYKRRSNVVVIDIPNNFIGDFTFSTGVPEPPVPLPQPPPAYRDQIIILLESIDYSLKSIDSKTKKS